MNIRITPNSLIGKIKLPASKSISHRALICAALCSSETETRIENVLRCEDTEATIQALIALGAVIKQDGNAFTVRGIKKTSKKISVDCCESGSTLRFLMPIAAALGIPARFTGCGMLPKRPITPYFTELQKNGIIISGQTMPYSVSGQLLPGEYRISGGISSQFITGLLFSLPLLDGNSSVILTSPLQSKPYVDITIDCLKKFGIEISENENGYFIKGRQKYSSADFTVEPDLSQAAFFLVANAIGSSIDFDRLNKNSVQGDAVILDITESFMGKAFDIDASQIPDLVPILTVLASFSEGTSRIRNCSRLRIKECDRLSAISDELNNLGAVVNVIDDELLIRGVKQLRGGICNGHNDHRIVMSLAIASQRATSAVVIRGAECVKKSYPDFFRDFAALGGVLNVIDD